MYSSSFCRSDKVPAVMWGLGKVPSNIKVKYTWYHLAFIVTDAQTHTDKAKAKSCAALLKAPVRGDILFFFPLECLSTFMILYHVNCSSRRSALLDTPPKRIEHISNNDDHIEDNEIHCHIILSWCHHYLEDKKVNWWFLYTCETTSIIHAWRISLTLWEQYCRLRGEEKAFNHLSLSSFNKWNKLRCHHMTLMRDAMKSFELLSSGPFSLAQFMVSREIKSEEESKILGNKSVHFAVEGWITIWTSLSCLYS